MGSGVPSPVANPSAKDVGLGEGCGAPDGVVVMAGAAKPAPAPETAGDCAGWDRVAQAGRARASSRAVIRERMWPSDPERKCSVVFQQLNDGAQAWAALHVGIAAAGVVTALGQRQAGLCQL